MSEEEARRRLILGAFEDAVDEDGFAPEGYEISGELARGGMAVVYLARQLQPEREVALKIVQSKFAGDEEIRERFQREGEAMAALDHPGVLPVYQVGNWDGLPFITMKLARGGSLEERLSGGLPEVGEAVDWLIDAGEAVHFANQRGVLHRDLKPGNLLFDGDGKIYVGDFGVAKLEFVTDGGLTRTEALVGTPNYLAPEVASGSSSGGSVAADLYGLGAVMYECLTGKRPHEDAENLAAQLRAVVDDEIVPVRKIRPEVAGDLEVICGKALAKDPDDRYATLAEFVEDLQRWREGRDILARPAGPLEKSWRWALRHRLAAALLGLLAVVLVSGSVLFFENYKRRGELLHESLVERARGERKDGEPGFRQRALGLLKEAGKIRDSDRIREEAVAVLAHWDAASSDGEWGSMVKADLPSLKEEEDGLRIVGKDWDWFLPGGVLRCEPAWSPDGRFLAAVRGDSMEVFIYDVDRCREFARVRAEDWPERLVFGKDGERLKVEFSDGTAILANVWGKVLLKGFGKGKALLAPVGFRFWKGQYNSPLEVNPYGGKLSPDQKLLATTSATGVQLWDVEGGRSVEFCEAENQRIDAPTDVWWVGRRKLLLQVPGALEILSLDEEGRLLGEEDMEREPGTKLRDIRNNGDWVVDARMEDGTVLRQLWPGGDLEKARELPENEVSKQAKVDAVSLGDWVLPVPYGGRVQQVFRLKGDTRIIAITSDYRVCEWDLDVLKNELQRQGL